MASRFGEINLTKYDDLFRTEEERQVDQQEHIVTILADQVYPYARQPYTVERPTPDLVRLMDSIERIGIAKPLIVRPREAGGYEIISGHRRDYCAKVVGLETRPAIVREYTDEEADILVATKKDFEKQNRRKFCGRIATGDYDAVIIGHSQFEKIPMSDERQKRFVENQIDDIMDGIAELKANQGERFQIKQLEKAKKSLQRRSRPNGSNERLDSLCQVILTSGLRVLLITSNFSGGRSLFFNT